MALDTEIKKGLPTASIGTLKDGIWFIQEDGHDVIRAWGSTTSGKERIFFNDRLVSTGRSMTKVNVHSFTNNGNKYRIENRAITYGNGPLECWFFKNDQFLGAQRCHYTMYNTRKTEQRILGVLMGIISTAIILLLDLSYFYFIGTAILVLAGYLFIVRSNEMKIEVIDPNEDDLRNSQ